MITADMLDRAEPARRTANDELTRRHLRIAGLGALGAFLAWLGQPILVILVIGSEGDSAGDWSEIESHPYHGLVEVLIFSAMGVGMLFLVLATWRIVRLNAGKPSVGAAVGQAMGLLAAVSWFLIAAESFRMFTSVGAGIPDVTGDVDLQATIIEGTALDITGALLLFTIGFTGWAVMLATVGRKAGVVGRPLAVVLIASALVWAPALARPFSIPWPLLSFMLATLILGISFLVRSRR